MRILFLGDIFGLPGVQKVIEKLPIFIEKNKIDFVIAQSENVSGRKGLIEKDYLSLKSAGINAFTLGNHVWAKEEIHKIINNEDIIRPFNINEGYAGLGTRVFLVKQKRIRVTQMMGISFNKLLKPWKQEYGNNFFDAFDSIENDHDYHIIDFHAETTSEKNVFALYLDGKIDALIGTHTHVQTADERILPKGTAFISDVGMTGPINCAIGASYETVYKKMRYDQNIVFQVSKNPVEINGVLITIEKNYKKINRIKNNKIF